MYRITTSAFIALLSAGAVQAVEPFFVYNHHTLIRTRLDPIIDPGKLSAHTHLFSGANKVTADANFASITSAKCTTAPITIDKSLYWAPQLYYKDVAGKYTAINGDGIVTYWFYHRTSQDPPSFPELPDDFRMVAGDMKRNSINMTRPLDQAVSFQCFGPGYDHYRGSQRTLTVRQSDHNFPNCWNQKDAYKPDNSHVRYAEGDEEYGVCPEGFRRIPTLFLETYYKPSYHLGDKYKWRPGSLVFAHGDNFGLTFHADWMNGFPKGALNTAYDQCNTTLNGTVASCPYLAQYIQSEEARDCLVEGQLVNEPVGITTPLTHLPGNNVEYNSSALEHFPKKPNKKYVEKSKIVPIDSKNGGTCRTNLCKDYTGPRDMTIEQDSEGGGGGGGHGNVLHLVDPQENGNKNKVVNGVTATEAPPEPVKTQTETKTITITHPQTQTMTKTAYKTVLQTKVITASLLPCPLNGSVGRREGSAPEPIVRTGDGPRRMARTG